MTRVKKYIFSKTAELIQISFLLESIYLHHSWCLYDVVTIKRLPILHFSVVYILGTIFKETPSLLRISVNSNLFWNRALVLNVCICTYTSVLADMDQKLIPFAYKRFLCHLNFASFCLNLEVPLNIVLSIFSGPSCSKLTTSLVNGSLKFTSSDTQIF